MSDSSVWNKRVKNNPNGMATVAKSDHFHALERLGRNPLALGQNFVSSINRELDWVNHIGVSSSLFYKFIERQLGKTPA